jgi:hypothetical protein
VSCQLHSPAASPGERAPVLMGTLSLLLLLMHFFFYRPIVAFNPAFPSWKMLVFVSLLAMFGSSQRLTHTNLLSPGVFSLVVTSQLSHKSSGPRTSCRPTHCLRTPSSLTHGNSVASAGSVYSPAGTYSLAAEPRLLWRARSPFLGYRLRIP